MSTTKSQLSMIVASQGIKDAVIDLDNLAKAAKNVDKETKAFVIAQAKANTQTKANTSGAQAYVERLERQAATLGMSITGVTSYTATQKNLNAAQTQAALAAAQQIESHKSNVIAMKAAEKATKDLASAEAKRNLIQQRRDTELFNMKAKEQAAALDSLHSKGSIWNNTLKSMAVAAAAYVGVGFLGSIVKQADAWSMLTAKLKLTSGSAEAATEIQGKLYKVAQDVRIPLVDAGQLYNRLAISMKAVGETSSSVLTVTKGIGTALKLFGSTGAEASSAMLQLSQSFNAGRLNGAEFNSVNEAAPNILVAIREELIRTGRGAELASMGLKEMGSQGLITTKIMSDAIKAATPQWEKEFNSLPVTVDSALERIKNAWTKAVGEVNLDKGFNARIVEALNTLETALPDIAKVIGTSFAFIVENMGKISALIGILSVGSFASWLVTIATNLKLAAGATTILNFALGALAINPVVIAITALAVVLGAGYLAWSSFSAANEEARVKSENYRNMIPNMVKDMAKETAEIRAQNTELEIKLGLKERDIGSSLDKKPRDRTYADLSEVEKIQQRINELVKAHGVSVKNNGAASSQALANQSKILEASQALATARQKETEVEKNSHLNTMLAAKEEIDKKYTPKIDAAKLAFKTEKALRDQQLKDGVISQTLYNKAMIGLNKELEEATKKSVGAKASDPYATERSGLERMIDMRNEAAAQLEALQNGEDKRTEAAKQIVKIETDIKNATKAGSLALLEKQLVNAKAADIDQQSIAALTAKKKAEEEANTASANSLKSAEDALQKQLDLLAAFGMSEGEIEKLQADRAKKELERLEQNKVGTDIQIANQKRIIAALEETSRVKSQLDNKKTAAKEAEDAFKRVEQFLESNKLDKFGKSFTGTMSNLGKAVTNVSKVLENMAKTYTLIGKRQEDLKVARASGLYKEIDLNRQAKELEEAKMNASINLFGDMSEAAKGFFAEGTKGYQTLDGVSKIVHSAQLARNLVEMTQLAFKAVLNQAGGDPYTAFGRMAAMAAIVAGLGYAVGGGFQSTSGGGATAAEVQKTQGTGTVFGDATATSSSVATSLELMKSSFDKLYPVNKGMLTALKNIESSMSGLTNLVLRDGGIVNAESMNIKEGSVKSSASWLTSIILGGIGAPIVKWMSSLWGKTTTNVVDSGLQFGGSLQNLKQGQGINQYASVDTTKSSWFGLSKSTSNSVQTQGLSDEINSQFALIFTNMQKSLEEAGKVLYGSSEGVTSALNNMVFEVSKVSLKGLTGQALTDAINGVVSKALDQMADTAFSNLDQFRQVGEGYAQTVLRVANSFSLVNSLFDRLGLKLFSLSDVGIKASIAFTEMFDSIEDMQSIISDYYENFYTEQEKQEKTIKALKDQFSLMNEELPSTIAAYRALVDATTDPAKIATLVKLSSAFYEVFETVERVAKDIPDTMKEAFNTLASDAERWLNIRNQASSLKSSISDIMGNPKKDPAIRMQQLWESLAKDITPEQKLSLAGELKDLMLEKYQVEKDSLTRLIDFGKQLRTYVESLKVGSLSPLTVGQKLAEAQAQYQATFAKASGGDTTAQGQLQGKADAYLQLAQVALASSGSYAAIFNEVTGGLDSLGIESMSAADVANQTATEQLAELQKLSDFIGDIENTADNYYTSSLSALATQINLMESMYLKMGVFDGMVASLASLPAEIAAALSGKVGNSVGNDEFIRNLYQQVEGRVGSQVDQAGYNYWMNDLQTSTKEQVSTNFSAASLENATNRATQNLENKITELTMELKGLREDQNRQTGDLIVSQAISTEVQTTAIVEATREVAINKSWKDENIPSLQ